MNFRPAATTAVLALLGLAACGSDDPDATTATTSIKLGQTSYVTAAPVLAATTTVVTTAPGQPGAVAGEQVYTVVSNDYIVGIAKKHCIKADALIAYNAWPEGTNHQIFPGDQVKVPPGACAPGAQTEATTAPSTGADAGGVAPTSTSGETTTTFDASAGGTYTVVKGDYLNKIAENNGTTVDAIVAANGWSDGAAHNINPGDKIKLPAKTG